MKKEAQIQIKALHVILYLIIVSLLTITAYKVYYPNSIPIEILDDTDKINKTIFANKQADCLRFSEELLCSSANYVRNLFLRNDCSKPIQLVGIRPSWTGSYKIYSIIIDDKVVWQNSCDWGCSPNSSQQSGIKTFFGSRKITILPESTIVLNQVAWTSGKKEGMMFEFIFSDESEKTIIKESIKSCT